MDFFDDTDRKLIEILQKDVRASSAEIARQLGILERTVRNRIKRLVERDAIALTAVVNHRAFGYTAVVDVFCEVDEIKNLELVASAIANFSNVNYVAISTGDQDVSVQAMLKSSDDLYPFLRQIAEVPGVRRTRSILTPMVVKNPYTWLPPQSDFGNPSEKDE